MDRGGDDATLAGLTTLWRPVGLYELRRIADSSFRAFPPRLPEQPIFYPVCNEEYAAEIATRWNLDDPSSGFAGFVTRFTVPAAAIAAYPPRIVGGARHAELWVPAAELPALCEAFTGPIEVVRGWLGPRFREVTDWPGPLGELPGGELGRLVEHIAHAHLAGGPMTEEGR
jgi:hypothetical protein